ncbi:MAG: hypothetical protein DRP67_05780 [Candidatus Omnitrophota bacterium]|nr:MAG: hypothetical protein DRP67_05780 [Candidatus Omnitrophota bacterium]
MIERIYILNNKRIEETEKEKEKLIDFLKKEGKTVQQDIDENTDLLITLGGDGTLLKGFHLVKIDRTLIFGVKFGKIGFMTNKVSDIKESLKDIFDGNFVLSERMVIGGKVVSDGKVLYDDFSLNEIVIFRKGIRIIGIRGLFDGDEFLKIRADGIIISTPTGSTAHNLSSGGPILFPEIEAIVVSLVCPYTLSSRSIVLPADRKIYFEIDGEGEIIFDGQRKFDINSNCIVEISKSERKARLVFTENVKFFERLRERFGFFKNFV